MLYCAPALAWLIVSPHTCGDSYRGRWASQRGAGVERSDDIRSVGDGAVDFADMDDTMLNITPGLLQSMRDQVPGFVDDYQPRFHDVQLVRRIKKPGACYELADPVSATCKCGWRTGPIYGASREHVLELSMAAQWPRM